MARIEPFEEYSDEYDRWFEEHGEIYEAEVTLLRLLLPGVEENGIEIGVGSGKFAAPLQIEYGVEPSEKMASKARKRGITVYPGIAEDLPLENTSFDYAVMITTICFVDDIEKSFREVHRVLKDGGLFILGFVDRESELGKHYQKRKGSSRFYRDATFHSAAEVLELLEQNGFTVTDIKQTLLPDGPVKKIADGYGRGSFVGIQAKRKNRSRR